MQLCKIPKSSRLTIFGIIMSIILVLPQINSGYHNPIVSLETVIERHQFLEFDAPGELPHVHENGTHEESHLDHQHGHNNADHTHNPLYISSQNNWAEPIKRIEPVEYLFSHTPPTLFLWQRPPKLAFTS
jgi:hypothetical protein